MLTRDSRSLETHFAFGKNWASYAKLIDKAKIDEAKKGLLRLIPAEDLAGKSFLDIGCGSGLHSLAATHLGASRVMAIDIDPDCVAITRNLLLNNNVSVPCLVETKSVFELGAKTHGVFDIVYSWGVLHHTGSMWEAVNRCASMVAPNGLLVIALYSRTHMDHWWKIEKRMYAHAPGFIQTLVREGYIAAFRLAMFFTGRSFQGYVANYKSFRGMDYLHDVHDWLGGYPYETATAAEVDRVLVGLGLKAERVFARPMSIGLFGSGCDEYVYRLRLAGSSRMC
jgi:2-polyprenyl-6-hydroxyphenyl methylase/3-demethylubiquinone-9 3-methyltransferase